MEKILHHLGRQEKPLQMMVNKLPTSSGVEFTGFLVASTVGSVVISEIFSMLKFTEGTTGPRD